MSESTYAAMREFIKVSVELEVNKALAARPAAPVETRSDPVIEVREGPPGRDGTNGKDGRDGVDGAASTIPGPKGKTGDRGADGIASLEELRAEVQKAVDASVGPAVQKSIAALPTLQYQGVFREGTTYKPGECVTWAGSMWHADSETKDKPGEGETSWTLIVKRGDKGRDAK